MVEDDADLSAALLRCHGVGRFDKSGILFAINHSIYTRILFHK